MGTGGDGHSVMAAAAAALGHGDPALFHPAAHGHAAPVDDDLDAALPLLVVAATRVALELNRCEVGLAPCKQQENGGRELKCTKKRISSG